MKADTHLCVRHVVNDHMRSIEINYDTYTKAVKPHAGRQHAFRPHMICQYNGYFKSFFLFRGKFEVRFIPLIVQKI